jgi:hypothetical protein
MKKVTATTTARKNNTATKHNGPGRPRFAPKFPRRKEWTFTDFMEVNDIQTNQDRKDFGKGPNCTMLTLRKFMARDAKRGSRSLITKVRGVTSEPNSEAGLGRRAYLYSVRVKPNVAAPAPKKASAPKAENTSAATHDAVSDGTKQYEELKSNLTATEAPSAVVIPAVTITPESSPAPAPEVAPVNESAPASEPMAA